MGLYDREKAMLNQTFRVITPWKIGQCKMKRGDQLTVTDYGSGMASHYVKFVNARLPSYIFTAGTWLFARNTKEVQNAQTQTARWNHQHEMAHETKRLLQAVPETDQKGR